MSRLVLEPDGEVRYERSENPCYICETLPEGTDWKAVVNEQERIPYDFKSGELVRYFLIPIGSGIQMILMAHHLAGDGKSMMILLRDIMNGMNGRVVAKKKLEILQNEDIKQFSTISPMVRLFIARLNHHWKKERQVFQAADYKKMFYAYWNKHETVIDDIIFTAEETSSILKRCKEYDVTVNSYLTTAILKAYNSEWAEVGYAVDIRKKKQIGMGNFVSGQAFETTYVKDVGFRENAWRTDSLYKKQLQNSRNKYFTLHFLDRLDNEYIDSACMQIYTEYDTKSAQKLVQLMGYDGNKRELSLSNLTKYTLAAADDTYRMENLLFVPPVVPYGVRLFGMVTLDDKLGLALHYDHKKVEGKRLFQKVVDAIREDIGSIE
jgi:hemerythrin